MTNLFSNTILSNPITLVTICAVTIVLIAFLVLKIKNKNLEILKMSEYTLKEIISNQGAKSIKHVGVMTVDGDGKVYFQTLKGRYKTFNINLTEGVKW